MNSSGRDGSTVWTVKVRWMLAVAGVFVVLALVSIWLAQPGPVTGYSGEGPVRDDNRLFHFAVTENCALHGWVYALGLVGACVCIAAALALALGTVRLIIGTVRLITGRESNGSAARSESAALIALALAVGAWGFLTVRVVSDADSVCAGF